MKNIFICSTEYQLFNIVNIINTYYIDDENVLFILDCIAYNKKLKEIAKKANIFTDIKIITAGPINGTLKSYIVTLRCIFGKKFSSINVGEISRVFITFTEIYSRILACEILKQYPRCELYFYEDGMASYTNILSKKNAYNKTNRLLKLKYGSYLIEHCCGLYIYKTEYVMKNDFEIILKQIPSIAVNSEYAKKLYDIFANESMDKIINKEFIFFDSWFNSKQDIEDSDRTTEKLLSCLKNRIIVKPHPSNMKKWNNTDVPIFKSGDSFEIYYLMHSFEKNVLISAFSTACLLPKLIFDEEPRVILLYNLYRNYPDQWENRDAIYKKIRESYHNVNDFFIPSSSEELEDKLNNYLKRENNYEVES